MAKKKVVQQETEANNEGGTQDAPQPDALLKGLASAGYKKSDIYGAPASYEEQKLYRVVTRDGQRHEISYDGKLLKGGSIAYRQEAAKKKKEKAAK